MKYYRTLVGIGTFEYARIDHRDLGRAEYFDDEDGSWVVNDTLHAEIASDGSWRPCSEEVALSDTRSKPPVHGA